ncbi:MAG: hypothetical protein ACRC8A_13045 [Microcoleaceae cyanobacterium]
MNQATAFVGGSLFTILTALLLLIVWLMFGEIPKPGRTELPQFNSAQGVIPPPPQLNSSYSVIPLNPTQPGQAPYNALPSAPVLPPPPAGAGESEPSSQFKSQLDQQQGLTQQLTSQLDQQRTQNDQLRGQLEQQKAQIEQLTSQFEQQRVRTEQLMMQLQEQQRLIVTLNSPGQQISASVQSPATIQSAVLWTLVGVVLALFLGGGMLVLSVIALIAQPQRRVLRRYPAQSINMPWSYELYEDPSEFLPPNFKPRRTR